MITCDDNTTVCPYLTVIPHRQSMCQKRPINCQNRPIHCRKRPMAVKRNLYTRHKRGLYTVYAMITRLSCPYLPVIPHRQSYVSKETYTATHIATQTATHTATHLYITLPRPFQQRDLSLQSLPLTNSCKVHFAHNVFDLLLQCAVAVCCSDLY